ncbi:MAG: toll/interleukin-1 receptor domain-containing protein [Ruminococcaceae bacterium]|nr:toll/interleukin-1 receptor domain-containing protein [Oscillospiraceae bacterium]
MPTTDLHVYKGNDPYIFVSYAHRDADRVFPLIGALQEAGYRVWFDQGIEAGTEWSNNIASHLSNCSTFLFFTSSNSVQSENCLDEVAYAKSHKKPALLAFLEEDVVLPDGTEMQTARFQRMYVNRQRSMEEFIENFTGAAMFDACREVAAPVAPAEAPAVSAAATAPAASVATAAPTTITKIKKPLNKALVIGIAAVAAVIVAAVVLLVVFLGSSSAASSGTMPEGLQLSASLSDHTFRLEGTVYKLPLPYQDLLDQGWAISSDDLNGLTNDSPLESMEPVMINLERQGKNLQVVLYNESSGQKTVRESTVGAIVATKSENIDFCIAQGISFNATKEELIKAFGEPNEQQDSYNAVILQWMTNDYSGMEFMLTEDANERAIALMNIDPSLAYMLD